MTIPAGSGLTMAGSTARLGSACLQYKNIIIKT